MYAMLSEKRIESNEPTARSIRYIRSRRARTVRRRYVKAIQFNTELRRLMVGLKQRQCKAIG